jgi:hypothetical protein
MASLAVGGDAVSTALLKLPEDVKQPATAAAERADFVADAMASRDEAIASGKGFPAAEVNAYLRERAQGKAPAKPKARSWRN